MVSTFYYNSLSTTSRLLIQRRFCKISLDLKSSLINAFNGTRALEDISLLNSFRHLEALSGSKPALLYFGSRYIGTSKKSFSLLKVDLRSHLAYMFLERVTTLLLPNLQKRVGRLVNSYVTAPTFVLNCKDLQLFTGYIPNFYSDPLTIQIELVKNSYNKVLRDFLLLYKFNFVQ